MGRLSHELGSIRLVFARARISILASFFIGITFLPFTKWTDSDFYDFSGPYLNSQMLFFGCYAPQSTTIHYLCFFIKVLSIKSAYKLAWVLLKNTKHGLTYYTDPKHITFSCQQTSGWEHFHIILHVTRGHHRNPGDSKRYRLNRPKNIEIDEWCMTMTTTHFSKSSANHL